MLKYLWNPAHSLQALKTLKTDRTRRTWRSWKLGFLALSLLFFSIQFGTAQTPIPNLNAGVMDSAGILSLSESQILNSKIMQLEAEFGSQVAVLIIPELQDDEDILDYSVRVMEEWKLGRLGIDDGLLLVIALNDRKMRIEVGYDLEGVIPDITAYRIIEQHLQPAFRSDQYALGINNALDELIPLIQAEQTSKILPADMPSISLDHIGALDLLFLGFIFAAFVLWVWLIYQGFKHYLLAMISILCIALGLILFAEDANLQAMHFILINDPFLKEHLPLWMYQLLTSTLSPILSIFLLFSMFWGTVLILVKALFLATNTFFPKDNSEIKHSHSTSFKQKNSPKNSWEAHKENRRQQMQSHQQHAEKLSKNHPQNMAHHFESLQENPEISGETSVSKTVYHTEAPTIIDTSISPTWEKLKRYEKALKDPNQSADKLLAGFLIALGVGAIASLFAYAFFGNLLVALLCGISVLLYQMLYHGTNLSKNRGFKAVFQAIPSSASYGVVVFFFTDLTIAILVMVGFIFLQTMLLVTGTIKQPFRVIIISRGSSSRSSSSSRSPRSSGSSSRSSHSGRTGGGGKSGGGGASGSW